MESLYAAPLNEIAAALLAQSGLVVLGLVFLAEELYETGVLALIIRSGDYE